MGVSRVRQPTTWIRKEGYLSQTNFRIKCLPPHPFLSYRKTVGWLMSPAGHAFPVRGPRRHRYVHTAEPLRGTVQYDDGDEVDDRLPALSCHRMHALHSGLVRRSCFFSFLRKFSLLFIRVCWTVCVTMRYDCLHESPERRIQGVRKKATTVHVLHRWPQDREQREQRYYTGQFRNDWPVQKEKPYRRSNRGFFFFFFHRIVRPFFGCRSCTSPRTGGG